MSERPAYIGFPEMVRANLPGLRLEWKGRLSREPIAFNVHPSERVIRLVNEAADSRSAIARHLRKLFPKGQPVSDGLYRCYLDSYDSLIAFSDDYRDLLERVETELPRGASRHLVAGATSRNLSLFLQLRCAQREVVSLHDAGRRSAQGGVLNHVLGRPGDRRAILRKAFDALRAGGTLVLVEPAPKARSVEKLKGFLISLASSAVENHSPMTDFDLALVSYVSLHRLGRARDVFLGPLALEALCREVGFYVQKSESVHGGFGRMLVLRK